MPLLNEVKNLWNSPSNHAWFRFGGDRGLVCGSMRRGCRYLVAILTPDYPETLGFFSIIRCAPFLRFNWLKSHLKWKTPRSRCLLIKWEPKSWQRFLERMPNFFQQKKVVWECWQPVGRLDRARWADNWPGLWLKRIRFHRFECWLYNRVWK